MAFEERCRRCGRCCVSKVIIGGEVHFTPFFCRHLDMKTQLCTIYDHRHELNPDCLSVEEGILLGVFPADCPYVARYPHYRPPHEEYTEVRSLFDLLREVDEDRSRPSASSGPGARPPGLRPPKGFGPQAGRTGATVAPALRAPGGGGGRT